MGTTALNLTAATPAEQAANLRIWAAALRSGQYQQTNGRLHKPEGYCCLGVLCDLSGTGGWARRDGGDVFVFERGANEVYGGFLPRDLAAIVGLDASDSSVNGERPDKAPWCMFGDREEYTLAGVNDDGGDFALIADLLEAYAADLEGEGDA